MTKIVLSKNPDGAVVGISSIDSHHFRRLTQALDELRVGETLVLSWSEPRSPALHRAHFALLNRIFAAQQRFETLDTLRAWVTIGAGHCDTVPGPDGVMVVTPRSIAYDALDEEQFREHHARCLTYLRSAQAFAFLFPAASTDQAAQEMEELIEAGEDGADPVDAGAAHERV
jgi:hypothetical protein